MHVAVIGAGYVGLVTAACLAQKGHQVQLVELDQNRIETIKSGKTPFYEPGLDQLLKEVLSSGKLSISSDLNSAIKQAQVSFIAVGTPGSKQGIDLSQAKKAAADIGYTLKGGSNYHVVIVKSTVPPGTTANLVKEEIQRTSNLRLGQFGLCMNPEFLREGSAVDDFMTPDRIIIGEADIKSGKVLNELYNGFNCPIVHTSLNNAELIKYASNSLLSTLISFSNELASLCESVSDTDIDTVMDGLHMDKRLSPLVDGKKVVPGILSYLRAGCGFGGSCLPKDVNALREFAQAQNVKTPLLDAVMIVNERRPIQVVSLLERQLEKLDGKIIAVLGLAFKPNTDDLRDSPALRIIDCLIAKGAQVRAYDPLVSSVNGKQVAISTNVEAALDGADAVVIATACPEFANINWQLLKTKMRQPILIDGRRLTAKHLLPDDFVYQPIGLKLMPSAKKAQQSR